MAKADSSRAPDKSELAEFAKWATSPSAWFSHAEQLHRSSEVLWQPIGRLFDIAAPADQPLEPIGAAETDHAGLHSPAYLLLAGFAIEAMLKAVATQVELNAGGIDRVITSSPSPSLVVSHRSIRVTA